MQKPYTECDACGISTTEHPPHGEKMPNGFKSFQMSLCKRQEMVTTLCLSNAEASHCELCSQCEAVINAAIHQTVIAIRLGKQ